MSNSLSEHDPQHFDLAVVGSGILGLAHAYAAVKRGLKVAVFERTGTPLGASVRNFGMGLVTGQPPGIMLDLARESRAIWLHLAARAHFSAREAGTLLFARSEAEHDVLQEFMMVRARQYDYRASLLEGDKLNTLYNGRFRHHRSVLHGTEDLQLYSREAMPALVAYLHSQGVHFRFNTLVHGAGDGRLSTTAGEFRAERVVVCSGHDYLTLFADRLQPMNLKQCRLQMLRLKSEETLPLTHAVLTGLSCTHYGAFSDLPTARAVHAEIEANTPLLNKHGIHLLVSPTPYQELIVGDSHHYGTDAPPFNSEEIDELLLGLVEHTLATRVKVIERWQGVYGSKGPGPFSALAIDAQTSVVLMHTGIGMSVGLGLGERVVKALLEGAELPSPTAVPVAVTALA
ncbi:TIGR03364 family FAD-dependent oxidoreductase [Herbaspirillum seropedicae]|uniref:Secreted glycine/D-amino acid oxidase (Deaminating) protein n=1 Tax=Herbaspirillum seropedicae (strain SmR1) TaxID=757424 RepID=D8IU66_HERSS|nr:TIGR03364 family FAD-dependent oxidoreductase [Herbaspirillum seropedicae]ADJ63728.1 secreted glycine/D-amino acid oxidase (deaminating) protein [Herbaspirillum seropedicae SmR1]AKN65744.1 FAD-dependent oxidoreductase [Herbaspirillum seropedicae]NQE28900.1 FAD-dependent oxidoreductase [Herbaspirillum seropedicae]UMU21706.1 TIGR03364 family FAD-dependent oxidoreductase [Herbaspirillum seropedicae]